MKFVLAPVSVCAYEVIGSSAGGLIELNHGRPQPLQYVVNAAFLATLYSDYLAAADTPGWYCGPNFYSTDVLRKFAETQVCWLISISVCRDYDDYCRHYA